MPASPTPFDLVAQAQDVARRAGLHIRDTVAAGRRLFSVYRITQGRAVYLGQRRSARGLVSFVHRLAR